MQRFRDQSFGALSLAFFLRYLTLRKLLLLLNVGGWVRGRTDEFYSLSQILLLQHEKVGLVTLVKG